MSEREITICIDAGHGGHDSGAVGPTGLREKDVALEVALETGRLLQMSGFLVIQTRTSDQFVDLTRRAVIANDTQADAFLSIHCNAGPPGRGEGFEVFTTPGPTPSDPFATDLFTAYGQAFPHKLKRADFTDGDPDKEAAFTVLRKTHMRAALFELEFIHTTAGEAWLGDGGNQLRCARALADGVCLHFGKSLRPGEEVRAAILAHIENITQLITKL